MINTTLSLWIRDFQETIQKFPTLHPNFCHGSTRPLIMRLVAGCEGKFRPEDANLHEDKVDASDTDE